jgi:hypothetical protein
LPFFLNQAALRSRKMQTKNKAGINNPLFGVKKSKETLAKITKLVYVYDSISRGVTQ